MNKITLDYINMVAPEHGKTTCSDGNVANGYGGWYGKYDQITGQKRVRFPRCNRCYLLKNLGSAIDSLEFEVRVIRTVELSYKE